MDSPSFTHLINPHVPFCSFALQGICSDPECRHQHPDDIIPKDKQILEDLAAYFVSRSEKGSGDGDVMKSITRTIDAVTKQYGDKVSPADLRVLFVNDLRKQTSAGVFNIVLEPRTWWPSSHTKKSPETNAQDENPVVQTENTFSWKGWRRRIVNEIKMRSVDQDEWYVTHCLFFTQLVNKLLELHFLFLFVAKKSDTFLKTTIASKHWKKRHKKIHLMKACGSD